MSFRDAAAQLLLALSFGQMAWAAAPTPVATPILLPEPSGKPGEIVLTLDDCVRKAIAEATAVLKAEYNSTYSGAQLLQAYGQFLPNLTASARYGYATGQTFSSLSTPTYTSAAGNTAGYTVQTELNLFNGISDYSNLRSALLKKRAAELTVFRAKQQIKLDIIQSFYQVVLDHRIVDIALSNLGVSRERERVFTGQVEVGTRHLSDLFRQQAETSNQEFLLLSARNRLLADQLALLRRLRIDVVKGYRFIEPKLLEERDLPPMSDEKTLIEAALSHRVDLKATADVAEAERWDVRTAWGGYLPRVNLAAGLSSSGSYLDSLTVNGGAGVPPVQNNIGYQLGNQIQYSLGLTLTWSLFDRFVTRQAVSRAQVAADSGELDLLDLKNAVEADVRKAYGDYLTVIQQLRSTGRGSVSAQKAYDVLSGRYGVGGVNLLDLLTGQDVLVQAQSIQAQSLVGLQVQEAALRFATGELPVE